MKKNLIQNDCQDDCIKHETCIKPNVKVEEVIIVLQDLLDVLKIHSIGITGDYRSINDGELEEVEERARKLIKKYYK